MRSEVPPRPDHGWPYRRWAGYGQSVFRCRSGDRFYRTCGSVETVCRDGRPPQNRTRRNRAARRDRHRIGDRTGRTERRPHRHRGQHGGTHSRRRGRGSAWSDDRARGDRCSLSRPAAACAGLRPDPSFSRRRRRQFGRGLRQSTVGACADELARLRELFRDRGGLSVGDAVHARGTAPGRGQGGECILRPARDGMVPNRAAAEGDAGGARRCRSSRAPARARGRVCGRRRRGHPATPCRQPKGARARNGKLTGVLMTVDLMAFARAVANGGIRVIDLTQTLAQEFPTIALPPELGQCAPFRMEEVSRYDERGPAWYWNNISLGEHTGTHFDAPVHWISGKDLPHNSVDTIPPANFIAPAAVIDISRQSAANPDYELTVADVEAWEKRHGRIPSRSWVLLRTDWSKRQDREYVNMREDGQHTPGPCPEVVRFLVEERDVHGLGTETIGTDAGQAFHFNP